MNNNVVLTIPNDLIITKSDKVLFLETLSAIKSNMYKVNSAGREGALGYKVNSAGREGALLNVVPDKFFQFFETFIKQAQNSSDLDKLISTIEKNITEIPVAHLTLSYTPTKNQVYQLANKLRQKFPAETIIDYSTNSNLGVGIQIDFSGKTYEKNLETII